MARNVWNALQRDQALPVGTTYTDGNGAQLVVPDPNAAPQSSAAPSGQDNDPSTPGTEEGSTDNTEQSVSVDNNAANEAAAQQTVASCPPKDK